MPYLGNNHIVGDSVNNFKVLDDISSFTATFDGSATSVVSTSNETIRVPKHRFVQGQRVTYNNGGGSNIGGLSSSTAYYVIYDTEHTIKLATSASNAASLTAINLNAVGGGTSHTLNAAFDGINKKFRITHGNGNRPRFHHPTQLSVAINNVVQRPNNDANNFTEGYAVEVRDIIVFKTAPTVDDIFFGSLTGETRGTFDITNHKIDNYTGDGSTTLYNLSQNVPNNESLLVSLNGVIQHPTTGGVTRSYSLVSGTTNRLQFTTAPASGVEIQIRHLGFAGANSGDVSGFYGRTGNVGLTADDHITTGDITSRNINSSGIITATTFDGAFSSSVGGSNANFTGIVTSGVFKGGDIEGRNLKIAGLSTFVGDASFSGNVSIGGTLTYEDVTNIDSVGIVTALGFKTIGVSTDAGVTNGFTAGRISIYDNNSHNIFRIGSYPSYAPAVFSTSSITFSTNGFYVRNTAATRDYIGINNSTGILQLGYGAATNHGYKLETSAKGIKVGTGVTIETNGQATYTGIVTATLFSGDGSELTGVSGFSTALSNDTSSLLNQVFKTNREASIASGTVSITSDAASGNVAFTRLNRINVTGSAVLHVGAGTTFIMNVLNVF